MAADEQPEPGEFLPGGAGWEAWQKKIRDDVNAAFELPEDLTFEWEQIKSGDDSG